MHPNEGGIFIKSTIHNTNTHTASSDVNENNKSEIGKKASIDGFAHEHIVLGILMKKYQNVSLVDLPLSPYDIIIAFKEESGEESIIRCQVKTSRTSISFTGGSRGGVDRTYIAGKNNTKIYIQSPESSDIVIGIQPINEQQYNLYFVPTLIIKELNQKTISINKIQDFKNNYQILENCKNEQFVINKCIEYGILDRR
jgi:hypothetical protein